MASIRPVEWKKADGTPSRAFAVDYKDQSDRRRVKQFKKRRDANEFITRLGGELSAGTHVADRDSITVAEAASAWLEACEHVGRNGREPVEKHTLRQYKSHVEHHILPLLGGIRLNQLNKPQVVKFRSQLLKMRSRAMTSKVLTSLSGILEEAQAAGSVAQNVAHGVRLVTSSRHKQEVFFPSRETIKIILRKLDALANQKNKQRARRWRRYRAIFCTSVFTGLRPSEIRGFPKSGFDRKTGAMVVSQRADETGKVGVPKSASGSRTIYVPDKVRLLLSEWLLECPAGEFLFPNWKGNVESLSNIHRRGWYPLLAVGDIDGVAWPVIEPFDLYCLRHFRASEMIATGINPKEIQKDMGHSSINVTFDIYGHIFPDDEGNKRDRANDIAKDYF